MQTSTDITIRLAHEGDTQAIATLAALDSRPVPTGTILLAEVAGEPWAAVAIDPPAAIADPFRPTADVVGLLRERALQLGPARPRPARRAGFARILRLRFV